MSGQRKKIIFVANSPLFFNQHLRPIVKEISKIADIYLVALTDPGFSLNHIFPNFRTIVIPGSREPSFLDPVSIILFLYQRVRIRPNIVISFTPKGGLINAITRFSFGKNLHYFTGQRWMTMVGMKRFIYKSLDKFIGRSCIKIACDSKSQMKLINESLGLSKIDIIGHGSICGVNTDRFRAVDNRAEHTNNMLNKIDRLSILKNRSHDLVIGYVGRLHEDKGIDIAINVCYILAKRNIDAVLIAIGPIEMKESSMIKKAVDDGKMIHLSYKEEIHEYYPLFDLLVLPSLREGFGSVIIEAASCRVPVIATDIPGPRDFIVDCKTGILVKRRTAVDFSEAIVMIYENKALRENIVESAYQKAKHLYSENFVSNSFKEWMTSML